MDSKHSKSKHKNNRFFNKQVQLREGSLIALSTVQHNWRVVVKTTFDRLVPGRGLEVVGLVQDHNASPTQQHHEACHVTSS